MIHGFRLCIKASELRTHCYARSAHHEGRAKVKQDELPALKEALSRVQAATALPVSVSGMIKNSYHHDPADAVETLESDIREHRNRALLFAFFAEHLYDDDYDLDENDLRRLELLK